MPFEKGEREKGRARRTVKVTLAVDGDAATTTGSVVLEDTNLLEGLEDLALDRARAVGVLRAGSEYRQNGLVTAPKRLKEQQTHVRRALAAVDRTAVELGEGANTDVLACARRGDEVSA